MKGFNAYFLFVMLAAFILGSPLLLAQSVRGLVNKGVEHYNDKNYPDAEVNFKKGAEESPENFEAKFNLGDALFKQKRYEEAINSYQSSIPMTQNDLEKAKVHYNIGNSLLKSQKVKESIEEYKRSLRLNPNDEEAKYNLSYALELLKNQNQKQQNKNQDKDQNRDQNKNQDQNKDQQQQDQKQNQQDQKNQESQQDNTKQQQQQPQKISKEEAERILQALKDNEKDLQKELRKIKGKRVKTDKDW